MLVCANGGITDLGKTHILLRQVYLGLSAVPVSALLLRAMKHPWRHLQDTVLLSSSDEEQQPEGRPCQEASVNIQL